MHDDRRARIRALNDQLRQGRGAGRIFLSSGVSALGRAGLQRTLQELAGYDNFDRGNDPHDEHDFGSFEVAGRRLFWKIDYYDPSMTARAEDPSDLNTCVRILTIMLAEEY